MPRLRWSLWCLALALTLAACAQSNPETLAGDAYVAGDGAAFVPAPERSPAPEVRGETLDGEPVTLAELDGPVVVNFWASWCGPCVREAPDLAEIHATYGPQGVHVLGVNVRDRDTSARRFEADLEIPYPSLYDQSAAIAASFGGVGPGALPSTIILDADHRVAARLFGAVTFAQVAGFLDRVLAEATPNVGTG